MHVVGITTNLSFVGTGSCMHTWTESERGYNVHEVMHKNPPTFRLRGSFHSTLIMTLLFKTL